MTIIHNFTISRILDREQGLALGDAFTAIDDFTTNMHINSIDILLTHVCNKNDTKSIKQKPKFSVEMG